MKIVLGLIIGVVGISTLSGCSAEAGEEVAAQQSAALTLVTATALSRGTRHDFNGDGKEDMIVIGGPTTAGSIEYLGLAGGGWSTPWTRTDLTNTTTSYAAGDFNHDGKTDLLITTANGTFEQTGNAGGGFNLNVWSNTAFKLGTVSFTVGDFNGDGWTDFIATTASGSYLYTGKGTGGTNGGFNANVWTNTTTAFKKDNVTFTPGNFNNDGTTDFIATTSTGSSLYTGKTTGGFNANVWTDSSLTNSGTNVSRFAVGNFDGVGSDDFIVQKFAPIGAVLYTGNANGVFTSNVWSDPTYTIDGSLIIAGDYNGDGTTDILVQDGNNATIQRVWIGGSFSGSIWGDSRYASFYDAVIRRGDYNGDGRDDFIGSTRNNTGNGTSENTGKVTSGFNSDVWTSSSLFSDSTVFF